MALNLTLTALGALSIWLDGQPWLDSGAIVVRDGGIYFSNDCSALHSADACRPMKAAPLTTHTGTDPIGSYSEVSVSWSAASTRTTADAAAVAAALMVTGLRTYASAPRGGVDPALPFGSVALIPAAPPRWERHGGCSGGRGGPHEL